MRTHIRRIDILKIFIIVNAVILSLAIAICTRFKVHNDEEKHYHAFSYFEGKWWPPDLGSNEVKYSNHGISRVFSRDMAYILYGNLSHLINQTFDIAPSYMHYRLMNVALFLITLCFIFFFKSSSIDLSKIGYVFLCIPQVYRIYAYANSDAWALSLSVFISILALSQYPSSIFEWKNKNIFILGILTGLLFVAKKNYLISLILPYSLIAFGIFKSTQQERTLGKCIKIFTLVVFPAFLIAAPLRVFYPLSQGDFKNRFIAAKEKYASKGFKPSNPYFWKLRLKEKGYTYMKLLKDKPWIQKTVKTFWGYHRVSNPLWIYIIVWGIALMLFLGTLWEFITAQRVFQFCLIISLFVIAVNIAFSLYYSLNFDYEPQGRYLYPSLVPISIWMTGLITHFRIVKKLRIIAFCAIYPLCVYSIIFIFIPALSRF